MAIFSPKMEHWRWFSDSNAEPVVGDALAAEDTEPTLEEQHTQIRLRLQIHESGGLTSNNKVLTLQYQYASSWYDLSNFNHWTYYNGLGTEGNVTTTFLLTNSDEHGEYFESDSNADDWTASKYIECDICILPINAVVSTSYTFRALIDGSPVPLGSGFSYPAVTTFVVTPPATGISGQRTRVPTTDSHYPCPYCQTPAIRGELSTHHPLCYYRQSDRRSLDRGRRPKVTRRGVILDG